MKRIFFQLALIAHIYLHVYYLTWCQIEKMISSNNNDNNDNNNNINSSLLITGADI